MTLKQDLLRAGYLPDSLPPPFHSKEVAAYFDGIGSDYLSEKREPVRPALYNTSKRGLSRRNFSAVHPMTAHDLAQFLDSRSSELGTFFAQSKFSLSVPRHTPESSRAVEIASHNELEEQRLLKLSGYRFIAKTDIARFYHSIYTHSVPWAMHGKSAAKRDFSPSSNAVFCNRLDQVIRKGQDGQTIGIPVGPDASRYIAELVAVAIDLEFEKRCDVQDYAAVRHVDDLWIGAHTHADAERALWRYREALREFELDINESKTRIYAENFHYSDAWPSEISTRLELAFHTSGSRRQERLRAALEFAFDQSVVTGDDGILKYAIRQIDRADVTWDVWPTVQPFLMRCSIHFGHTIDYVVRLLVWRHLAKGDLDLNRWTSILLSILDRQGRLGNDSEVVWALFAALKLKISIPTDLAKEIIRNCSSLSMVALLNCGAASLTSSEVFDSSIALLAQEDANGPHWPLFLEWRAKSWPNHEVVASFGRNEIVDLMALAKVSIFDSERLTHVFDGLDESDFSGVQSAIEARAGGYDDDDDDEDEEEAEF